MAVDPKKLLVAGRVDRRLLEKAEKIVDEELAAMKISEGGTVKIKIPMREHRWNQPTLEALCQRYFRAGWQKVAVDEKLPKHIELTCPKLKKEKPDGQG